jgi:hypothetical protein
MNVPVGFLEGFEIVERQSSYAEFWLTGEYPNQMFEQKDACGIDRWIRSDYSFGCENEFTLPCSAEKNSVSTFFGSDWPGSWRCTKQEPNFDNATYDQAFQEKNAEKLSQSRRGLSFGNWGWQTRYTRYEMGDGVVFLNGLQVVEDGSLTFRTPFQLEHQYVDIFTFLGVEGVVLSNLTFEGHSPIAWDEAKHRVSYLLVLDGGTEYTISQDSFGWPTRGTNCVTEFKEDAPEGKHLESYSEEFHAFHFSDFDQ